MSTSSSGTFTNTGWVDDTYTASASSNTTLPVTHKGDLVVGISAGTVTRLGVGTNGQIFAPDSATTTGLTWYTPALVGGTGHDGATEEALMLNSADNKLYRRTDVVTFDPANNDSIYNKTVSTTTNNILIGATPIDSWLDQSVKTNASPTFDNVTATTSINLAPVPTIQELEILKPDPGSVQINVTGAGAVTFPGGTYNVVGTNTIATMTNKSLDDTTSYFTGTSDATKKVQVLVGTSSTGTTTQIIANSSGNRTINLPNANTTLLGNNNSDTITNKTIAYGSNTITGLPVSSTGYAAYYVLNNTSIGNVSDTIVPYDTSLATDSGISNSSGTFTINTSGVYTIVATIGYLLSGAGFRRSYIMWNSSGIQYGQNRIIGSASIDGFMVSSFTAKLTAGDTIKVMTLQSSGGNLTLIGYNGFTGTSMTMVQFTRIS